MSVKILRRNLLAWGFFVLCFILALGPVLFTRAALNLSSQQSTAVVIDAPMNHDTCKYRFTVHDSELTGTGLGCAAAAPGASLVVYYWPVMPSISSNIAPGSGLNPLRSDMFNAFAILAVMLSVACFIPMRD